MNPTQPVPATEAPANHGAMTATPAAGDQAHNIVTEKMTLDLDVTVLIPL